MRGRLPASLAILVALTMPVAASALDFGDVNRMAMQEVASPAYATLAAEAAVLAQALTSLCAAPAPGQGETGPDELGPDEIGRAQGVRHAFDRTLDAWQRAQMIRVGPGFEGERPARIQFWPDKHGTAQRQVARALAAADPSLLDPRTLMGQSVALQGLPVIERLLPDAAAGKAYPCALARSAATVLALITGAIASEWQGYAADVLAAGSPASSFFSPFDPASAVLKGLADGLDLIVQQKLEAPLADSLQAAKPRAAESWRGQRSLRNVVLNLETAERLLTGPSGFTELLDATGGSPDLAKRMTDAFASARAVTTALTLPLERAVADPDQRDLVLRLVAQVKALRAMTAAELGPALGIGVGFNGLDGD